MKQAFQKMKQMQIYKKIRKEGFCGRIVTYFTGKLGCESPPHHFWSIFLNKSEQLVKRLESLSFLEIKS